MVSHVVLINEVKLESSEYRVNGKSVNGKYWQQRRMSAEWTIATGKDQGKCALWLR